MFEYHGWITIRETASDTDDSTPPREIVESLRHRIQQMASPCLLDLRWMNGEAPMASFMSATTKIVVTRTKSASCGWLAES